MSDEADYFVAEDGKLVLPSSIQHQVDKLVAAFKDGRKDRPAYKRITAWLDEYGDDVLFDYSACTHAIAPEMIRSAFESVDDADVVAALELSSVSEVTDAHRIAFMEENEFPQILDDGDDSSHFTPFDAVASNGTRVVLVNDVRGYSFSGITSDWFGPFATYEDFLAILDRDGWATFEGGFRSRPLDEKLRMLHG